MTIIPSFTGTIFKSSILIIGTVPAWELVILPLQGLQLGKSTRMAVMELNADRLIQTFSSVH